MGRFAQLAVVAVEQLTQRVGTVDQEVPPVGDLHRCGCAGAYALRVGPRPVTAYNRDLAPVLLRPAKVSL